MPDPPDSQFSQKGPRLLIEGDNTQRGANHAHSVWRDPGARFGLDVLARHHAATSALSGAAQSTSTAARSARSVTV